MVNYMVCVCVLLPHLLAGCVPRLRRWCRGCAAAAAHPPRRRRSARCRPWPGEARAPRSRSRNSAGSPGQRPSPISGSRARTGPAQSKAQSRRSWRDWTTQLLTPTRPLTTKLAHDKAHTNVRRGTQTRTSTDTLSLNYCSLFSYSEYCIVAEIHQ